MGAISGWLLKLQCIATAAIVVEVNARVSDCWFTLYNRKVWSPLAWGPCTDRSQNSEDVLFNTTEAY